MNNVVKNSKTSPKKSVTAKQLAKSNLTKRKNPDWDNLDRGYRYLTLDMKLPHDLAVAVMGNVVEESLGDYKSVLKNGGGRGLIQWDGRKTPNGRYSLWGSIWASVAKPANVYDSTTDTVKNYWAPWRGLKGDKVRLKFIKAPLKEKAKIYAESYLRPGKPRIADRQLSTMQLDSIYNPRIKDVIVLKDGGMLEFLKNGSGIHIKEKNKGKFTSYCGGKVTDECILKGKNSSNPAIRKRATFAANARKWKHEDGGLLELLPIYGTYKDFERFKENPNWRTGASLGLSALGDIALFTGAGAIVKGITTANKARRAYRAANSAANLARQKVWNAGSKLNRETLAVNSLTLMNAPTKTIMLRLALKNLAKQNYTAALNEDNKAFNALLKAGKNPNINFRGSDYIPFMVTNPSFHAASAAIKKNGGILKAQYGTPLNLSTEDIQGGLQYITQGLGKVWNIMNAPVVNVQPSTIASLPNGSQVEIPGTLTGIVDDSFGKGGGGKKVGKKLLQSVAKSKDKGLNVTKKVDSYVRHGLVSVDQDLRHFGGGNRRMDPNELIKEMDKHVEFKEFAKRLSKRLGNLNKDNPQAMKDFKALKNKYEDMFNDFLHNGIKKGQLGMALTLFNDSENPNAVGGDIVNSYIRNQLMIPYLLALKEAYEKWKLQMKLQANTLKSSLFDNLLNTGLSIGTDYLKSKLGIGTEKADS